MKLTHLEELQKLNINNPYTYLEIPESSSIDDIKKAFRNLTKRYNLMGENLQQDGTYVIEILQTVRDALLDQETKEIIDNNLQRQRDAYGLQTIEQAAKSRKEAETAQHKKTFITQAEATKQRSSQITQYSHSQHEQQPPTNYQYQQPINSNQELIISQLLNSLNLENCNDLSFADIQLIIKEYLKYNWDRYSFESIENGQDLFLTQNIYLLLDKGGQLTPVTTKFNTFTHNSTLNHLFSNQVFYENYSWKVNNLEAWNENIKENESLSTLSSIFPEKIAYNKTIKQGDIIKGIELSNECLLHLRRYGYLNSTGNQGKTYLK